MINPPPDPETAAPEPRRRRWRRVVLASALAALLALVAAAHLPPVRQRVLNAALQWANPRFGVVARATGLDYNLLTLRFTVHGPSVAAAHAIDRPFFAADRIEVDLPWSWVVGRRALQALRVDAPRLTIASDASDRFNLPTVRGTSGGGTPDRDRRALAPRRLGVDRRSSPAAEARRAARVAARCRSA